jgi:hypothetical protein
MHVDEHLDRRIRSILRVLETEVLDIPTGMGV